ncbi:exopolysaccharide biosynthesis protein [Aquicoccus sp. G2-2]|uniref:exopolysaccharide biosynthesis protein n=1 Tax=Aquicoccus sp. G2-2 TaxID=3092120 RepID=UPI002ADFEEE0|nr:exopolysaccharide biosynthesis protein [Aquicoccus sp. G2-2]MEA1112589.1 exopolysaccharide biosynthesis protein [Aquicoccus sp. G2-2]
MSENRRTFTRKSRVPLNRAERERLIAELATLKSGEETATFDLPHVEENKDDAAPEDTISPRPDRVDQTDLTPGHIPTAIDDTVDNPSDIKPASDDGEAELTASASPAPAPTPEQTWASLGTIPIDPAHLERNLIITAGRHDPAHGAFDVLRTRLIETLYEKDWKRVAITSPTRDCGKTFTSVNLAISLSRYETNHTVLMDMDMRNPSVAKVLGAADPTSMGDFLQGQISAAQHFRRLGRNALNIGSNLAIGLNDRVEPFASELLQDPLADAAFARMMEELDPDVVLYDLPGAGV